MVNSKVGLGEFPPRGRFGAITFEQEDKVMGAMDNWDVTLLVVAGYLAVVALVRLMARHRDQMLGEFRREIKKEKKREQNEAEWKKSA